MRTCRHNIPHAFVYVHQTIRWVTTCEGGIQLNGLSNNKCTCDTSPARNPWILLFKRGDNKMLRRGKGRIVVVLISPRETRLMVYSTRDETSNDSIQEHGANDKIEEMPMDDPDHSSQMVDCVIYH